jgi:hypothetical protein
MPAEKFYDFEFGAEPLRDLKKRDVLASSNPAHGVPLIYNLLTKAEGMEQQFQKDRKVNPLHETSSPETWIVAEIMPFVKEIRANVGLHDRLLNTALQRYLRCEAKPNLLPRPDDDEPLVTTIEPYIPGVKKLLVAVCDRRKSLREILRLRAYAYTVRAALSQRKPSSRRQAIFLRGIKEKWSNPRIAKELDNGELKPKNRHFKSYGNMYQTKAQLFHSIKHNIKKEFL